MFDVDLEAGERAQLDAGDLAPLRRVLALVGPPGGVELEDGVELFSETLAGGVRFALRLRRGGREQLVEGALGPGLLATVTDPGEHGLEHLLLGVPEELPRFVAEMVDIGPRPFDPDTPPIPMPYAPLDEYAGVGCGEESLRDMQRTFDGTYSPADLATIFDGAALRWTLALWPDGGDAAPAGLDVIDGRDRGLWLIDTETRTEDAGEDHAVVRPMTSSALWLMLSQISGDLTRA